MLFRSVSEGIGLPLPREERMQLQDRMHKLSLESHPQPQIRQLQDISGHISGI